MGILRIVQVGGPYSLGLEDYQCLLTRIGADGSLKERLIYSLLKRLVLDFCIFQLVLFYIFRYYSIADFNVRNLPRVL